MALQDLLRDSFTFIYVENTYRLPMACYGDSFNFLCVDDVRTSQKTHLMASTDCYGYSFTLSYLSPSTKYLLHL
jgi:hypothetical protein